MAKTTSGSILGVIRKESWLLDHFEIFVDIALNGTTILLCQISMLGGGLRSPSAFLVCFCGFKCASRSSR